MGDPLSNIEDEKAQTDMGVMLYRMYKGAIVEGATWVEAYLVIAAFSHGMFKSNQEDEKEEGGE